MSEAWVATALAPGLRVEVVPPPPPPPADVAAAVRRLWDAAVAARPALFNGRVFSARSIEPARITGWWTDYRHCLAQIREPGLFDVLGIRALAVNGVLEGPDGIVFGRRDRGAVYQAGLWQCPPAGSVEARAGSEAVVLAAQVLAELDEELGMPAAAAICGRPLLAVEHPGSHVVDVGIALATAWGAARIDTAWRARANGEYETLLHVPRAEVRARLAAWGDGVVPPARLFVDALLG